MNRVIAILEDDDKRAGWMYQKIAQRFPDLDCIIFDNAPDIIAWLTDSLEKVVLMSLDHDLGPNSERDGKTFDPGTGRDVVNFLITRKARFPVIIHTTNHVGGDGMRYALEDAGWTVKRVVPFNDFEEEWIKLITSLMKEQA